MKKVIYNVVDLGPGDGGKGTTVHKIADMLKAHTIIKNGGAQGNHGVCTSRGESFGFSHWGCATFEGVKSHISENFIIHIEGLLNEAQALWYEAGVNCPFDLLTVDHRALCASQYHRVASNLKELALGNNPRGTVGTGVGVAYRYQQRFPELTILAGDLSRPDLRDLLDAQRKTICDDLTPIIDGEFLKDDQDEARMLIGLLKNDKYLDFIANRFQEAGKQMRIVDDNYLDKEIFSQDGVIVVENSHGILTDHYQGFYPHVSAIRTLPCFTHEMLRRAGYAEEIKNIGVSRAYQIRHGAGPMPTDDPAMTENLIPGSSLEENRYRGKARAGALDLVSLRYAIEVCGGPTMFDGLAISWFDQMQINGSWQICNAYLGAKNQTYFSPSGGIRVRFGDDEKQIEHQRSLSRELFHCQALVNRIDLPTEMTREELYSVCDETLKEKVGVKVKMVSFGPTERDKICK